jgi:hypothetical protein
MHVTIDGQSLEFEGPLTILHAARKLDIDIPTMCYMDTYDPFTSCMICTVEVAGTGQKLPACTAQVADGMVIETQNETVRKFRKLTLDLLLSDHVGDCEAPCRRGCGVSMDIPQMIRHIEADDLDKTMEVIRAEMAMPSVLERFCHAPCETPCRRGQYDDPIAIKDLSRYASDRDLQREAPWVPEREPETGKRVTIVGAGSSGLSAAYFLALKGHAITVYEKSTRALDSLHALDGELPDWVVEGELKVLRALGVEIHFSSELGDALSPSQLMQESDALLLAIGQADPEFLTQLGLQVDAKGLATDKGTGQTSVPGVFACGNLLKKDKRVIRSFGSGKRSAWIVDQFVQGHSLIGIPDYYDHAIGKLKEGEIDTFVEHANKVGRQAPAAVDAEVFAIPEAQLESTRCLHCDCREKNNCDLRINSHEYGASQKHFKGPERATYAFVNQDAGAVYESGKCIKCGCCVHVTNKEGEEFGFAFVGRGFDLKTTVSLGKTLKEGLVDVAEKVVQSCPTGALSHNEKLGRPQSAPAPTPEP